MRSILNLFEISRYQVALDPKCSTADAKRWFDQGEMLYTLQK